MGWFHILFSLIYVLRRGWYGLHYHPLIIRELAGLE